SDYGEQSINNPQAISVINQIMKKNYKVAFQQVWEADNSFISNYSDSDPYHLNRIESGTDWTGAYLVQLLEKGHAKTLPFTDTFAANLGWGGTWGQTTIGNGQLRLQSSTTTTGAFAFL